MIAVKRARTIVHHKSLIWQKDKIQYNIGKIQYNKGKI